MEKEGATKGPRPDPDDPHHGGTMTKLRTLLRRLDAYTLETFNPPRSMR